MKRVWLAMLMLLAVLAGAAPAIAPAASADRYAEGQVWEYHNRPQDAGSLIKIRRIEDGGKLGTIYHISVIRLVMVNKTIGDVLPHTPVSRATLDASVTRLSSAVVDWPDVEPGIKQWRADKGGVFTVPVAEIIQMLDDSTAKGDSGSI